MENIKVTLKPIFHCDAKYLALGLALGNAPDARILHWRYQHVGVFWHYLTLKFASTPTPKLKFAFSSTTNPRCQSVEYRLRWVPTQNAGVGHVHFMFFYVDFICVWYPTRTSFPVEYGLKGNTGCSSDKGALDRHV